MNKLLLVALFGVAGVSAECTFISSTVEEQCAPCVKNIDSKKCQLKLPVCFEYVNCKKDEAKAAAAAAAKEAEAAAAKEAAAAAAAAAAKEAADAKAAADKDAADAAAKAAAAKAAADAAAAEALSGCPATKTDACVDKDTACAAWAAAGECLSNPEWMVPNCASSCCPKCSDKLQSGECPTADRHDLCVANKNDSCEGWASKDLANDNAAVTHDSAESQCSVNNKWMVLNCMSSCCDTCFFDKDSCPTMKSRCTNTWEAAGECKTWAAAGECTGKNSKWMHANCANECCTVCQPKPPARAATVAPRVVYPQQYYPNYNFATTQAYTAPQYTTQAYTAPQYNFGTTIRANATRTVAPIPYGQNAYTGYNSAAYTVPYTGAYTGVSTASYPASAYTGVRTMTAAAATSN